MSWLAARLPAPRGAFAFLGLGSNLGDRMAALQRAVDLLDEDARTAVDAVSSVYETEPVGGPEQEEYLNIAVRVVTRRSPRGLLALCNDVEARLGRVRDVRWGARTLDIDVLLYADRVLRSRRLEVPHPRMRERAFVLVPLMEVAPGLTLPGGGSAASALARLAPVEGVRMIGTQVTGPHGRPAR